MMQARILNLEEEHIWAEFVKNQSLGTIHQTPEWGHFQAEVPERGKYWIIVLEKSVPAASAPKIIAGTLLIRHSLPKGYCWLYAPRGPLVNSQLQMDTLLDEIKKIAKQENAIFLRVDPPIEIDFQCAEGAQHPILKFHHFRKINKGFQPEHTLMLDLTKSEQQLLAEMKPKGRYNIKLAEKKGVKIRTSDITNKEKFEKDLSEFYEILNETTSRDGFHSHNIEFYKNMLQTLHPQAFLHLAEYDGKIIAGSINTYFKDTATYYYGASGNSHRNLMAPYLLHWQAIKEAKAKGYKYYDLFGIAPMRQRRVAFIPRRSHPWLGVTEFKRKFGGMEISYQPAQEYAFKKSLYLAYRLYKMVK